MGGDIQNFCEGGRNVYGGTKYFMVGLDIPLETMYMLYVLRPLGI